MEIQQLRCFVAVVEHGSFTAAATALHVTQPSLSHAIARLETELRLRLFHRLPKGTSLTSEGEALLTRAREVLRAMDGVRTTASALHGVMTGTVRVVACPPFTNRLAAIVADFHRRFPHVIVRVLAPKTDYEVLDQIQARTCDVGFVRIVDVPPELGATAVTVDHAGVLLPDRSATPDSGALTLEQVARIPLIVPPAGTESRANIDRLFGKVGAIATVAAESGHYESTIEMVLSGVGSCLAMRESLSAQTIKAGDFRFITPDLLSAVHCIYRAGDLPPAAEAFVTVAGRHFPSPIASPPPSGLIPSRRTPTVRGRASAGSPIHVVQQHK
jgi:DNA-binding transcriptional LysR family regulator